MRSAIPKGYKIHLYLWQAVNNMDGICLGFYLDLNLFSIHQAQLQESNIEMCMNH